MKSILLGVAVAIGIGVVAALVLDRQQQPAYQAYVGAGANVDDPGGNLVGRNWNGLNSGRNVSHGHGAKS